MWYYEYHKKGFVLAYVLVYSVVSVKECDTVLSQISLSQIPFESVFDSKTKLFTVTVGDCVHQFSTEEQVLEFMMAVKRYCILYPRTYILYIRDYEFGLVLD